MSPVDMSNYVDVKARIRLFLERYPDGRLVTDRVEIWQDVEPPRVVVKALAYRTPDDTLPGVGWSWLVIPGSTNFTRGSEVENAETSAWGRAIGSLGIGIDASIATTDEIDSKKVDEKQPEPSVRESEGGLIGVASLGKAAPVDGELRETPDGWSIGFVLGEGREKVQVVATGELAQALAAVLPLVIGERVQCYGPVSMQTMRVGNFDRKFPRLGLVQIKTNDWTMPPPQAETVPLFPDDEEAAAIVEAEMAEATA
ncbi:MAG TPA: hypothetical protein VNN79_22110 [Actinomycetota bacterium]|nr:hypothetical protein [Actinomycetota bacterium]